MSRFATDADILALYPLVHADSDPAYLAFILENSQCMFRVSKWGCHLLRGHLAYVVHSLKTKISADASTGTGAVSGDITAMSEGPVSTSFGTSASANEKDSWLATTPEGKEYISMRRLVGVACGLPARASSCRPRRRCRVG